MQRRAPEDAVRAAGWGRRLLASRWYATQDSNPGLADPRPTHTFEPRLGQASDLAKPGGFRRAYVIANDLSGSSSSPQLGGTARRAPEDEATRRRRAYAARPLTEHLQQGGGPLWHAFVTDVVQSLPDGTRHQAPLYYLA